MQNPIRRLVAIGLALVASNFAWADNVVIVATPKRVAFAMAEGDLPEKKATGLTYVGGVYKTTLLVREVLSGSVSEKSISVDLIATSRENLSKAKSIIVALVKGERGEYKAIGWDYPRIVACVPASVLGDPAGSKSFRLSSMPNDERCAYLEGSVSLLP